jgi:hypothetical protein
MPSATGFDLDPISTRLGLMARARCAGAYCLLNSRYGRWGCRQHAACAEGCKVESWGQGLNPQSGVPWTCAK